MLERLVQNYRELEAITTKTDTRDILSHATEQSESYEDYFLVDIDAHVTETQFWPEIIKGIDNEVIRQWGEAQIERGRQHSAAQYRAGHDLSVPAWSHSAPSEPAGAGGEDRACIASRSSRAAPWTRSGSTIRSCSRPRCSRSACIRRTMSRSRYRAPITAGLPSASCRRTSGSRGCSICRSTRRKPVSNWSSNMPTTRT